MQATYCRIETVKPVDGARAIAVITRAFEEDPAARWLYPDPMQYRAAFPEFARVFGGPAFSHGSATHAEAYRGAALWLPPGAQIDDAAFDATIERTVAPAHLEAASAFFAQMGAVHPHEPHWYLPLIGVDPAHQGRGLGGALLAHTLEQCDRDRLPAYLEATSPASVALYRRHGLQPIGVIQAADSPPVIPMWRAPR